MLLDVCDVADDLRMSGSDNINDRPCRGVSRNARNEAFVERFQRQCSEHISHGTASCIAHSVRPHAMSCIDVGTKNERLG